MGFETQLNELIKEYRIYQPKTPEPVLRLRAITDVVFLLEKNIFLMDLRMKFNRHDTERLEILSRGLDRLKSRHSILVGSIKLYSAWTER